MKVIFLVLSLFVTVAQSHKYRTNFLGPVKSSSFVDKSKVEKITKIIREDLDSKVDQIVDLIATDLERELLKGGVNMLSMLQTTSGLATGSQIKAAIKKTLVSVLKSIVPMFERWIHDSVQPPVVDRHVYGALIHPIGYGVSEQIHNKLHIKDENPWKKDDVEEEGLEDEDEQLDFGEDDTEKLLGD